MSRFYFGKGWTVSKCCMHCVHCAFLSHFAVNGTLCKARMERLLPGDMKAISDVSVEFLVTVCCTAQSMNSDFACKMVVMAQLLTMRNIIYIVVGAAHQPMLQKPLTVPLLRKRCSFNCSQCTAWGKRRLNRQAQRRAKYILTLGVCLTSTVRVILPFLARCLVRGEKRLPILLWARTLLAASVHLCCSALGKRYVYHRHSASMNRPSNTNLVVQLVI